MTDPSANPSKESLRRAVLAARENLPVADRIAAAETVAARAFPVPLPPGAIVSGYMPFKSEFNPLPLMRKLAAAGATLALPVVVGRGHPLILRRWAFGEPLGAGVWGIREPLPDAPEIVPDIMLVPLAAFDRSGHRIGYGAGYYDMTIAKVAAAKSASKPASKPVLAVGLAYAMQEIGKVPAMPHDVRLDLVLTEREIIDLRSS